MKSVAVIMLCGVALTGCIGNQTKPDGSGLSLMEKCSKLLPKNEKFKFQAESTIDTSKKPKPKGEGSFSINYIDTSKQSEEDAKKLMPFAECFGQVFTTED